MTRNMRSHLVSNILSAFLLTIVSISAHALEVPSLNGHVNDYAGILSAGIVSNLEAQLVELEKSDSTQVVVLSIESLEGEVLEEFSIKVAETWKIGQQKVDNGVILLISKMDRKIRIEVGRGLEGKLTDLISGRIIGNEITPKFKNGDYDGGVVAGVSAIIAAIKGEYKASSEKNELVDPEVSFFILICFVIFYWIISFVLPNMKFSRVGVISCSLIGLVVFITIHSIYFPLAGAPWWFDIMFIFITCFIPGINLASGRGSFYDGGGSSSSFSGGSSSSFSGGSSSSYSGGGGSFGGGGASGSW